MYLRKRPTALLMHAYTSEGRALECQQVWWGQPYVCLRNLRGGGCPSPSHCPSISIGHMVLKLMDFAYKQVLLLMFYSSHTFVVWILVLWSLCCVIFFPFFSVAHLAWQNVNKDYVIFSFFHNFIAKSDQKTKMKKH